MRFVHPSSYQPHHLELIRQGSLRRAVLSNPWHQETLQKRVDEADFLLGNRSERTFTTRYSPSAHTLAGTSPHLSVQRKDRVHSNQVCVYESVYSATLPGVYNLSVWLQNVDYEHAFNLGTRGGWQRVQFGLLWSDAVTLTAIKQAEVWSRKGEVPFVQCDFRTERCLCGIG